MKQSDCIIESFNKINRYIKSCETDEQVDICQRMANNLLAHESKLALISKSWERIKMVEITKRYLNQNLLNQREKVCETFYSESEDEFIYRGIEDAVEMAIDSQYEDLEVGSVITVYKALIEKPSLETYFPNVVEILSNDLHCNYSEWSEPFISEIEGLRESIQKATFKAFKEVIDHHGVKPEFGFAKKVTPVNITITKIDGYDVEWLVGGLQHVPEVS